MTKKLWFQVGVGILITLFIIKYVVEVNWIFAPILIVLKTIFLPILISGVLFYITVPIQTFLEKRKVPRWGSITFILLLLIAAIWAAIAIVGPPITHQVNNLIENAPMFIQEANHFIIQLFQQTGSLPGWLNDTVTSATESLQSISVKFGKWIVQFLQSIIQGTLILVLVPFFLFFMLKDHEKFLPFVTQFFSGETKSWLTKTLKDIDEVLSLYIRGQILISTILATLLFIGYLIIDLNFALLLSVFALFMNVIPFIGPWIAFIPALIIGVIQDPMMVVWVSLTTLIAQQIDSNLITPNVMGKTLKIHPLTIITVLFAAGSLAGFLGILLAVPGYAVGKAIVSNIYEKRKAIKETANKTI
ncbi:AI-2E family transporter [Pseudogracilibacillus sp. SE30717A]|uniref:AI-2E family transporter n=1 Tax=Pseudogracilibacillus sp. SE30717A TaxID=3098293 RepID=UPI00300DF967